MNQVYVKMSEYYTATIRRIEDLKNHRDASHKMELTDIAFGTSKAFVQEVEKIIGSYKMKEWSIGDVYGLELNQNIRDLVVVGIHYQGLWVEYVMPQGRTYKGFIFWDGTYKPISKLPKHLKQPNGWYDIEQPETT